MFDSIGKTRAQVEYKFWASPGQGQTLEQLSAKMNELGNQILEIDVLQQRLLCAKTSTETWGCRFCLADAQLGKLSLNQIALADTESELLNHCKEVHKWKPGILFEFMWRCRHMAQRLRSASFRLARSLAMGLQRA